MRYAAATVSVQGTSLGLVNVSAIQDGMAHLVLSHVLVWWKVASPAMDMALARGIQCGQSATALIFFEAHSVSTSALSQCLQEYCAMASAHVL